MGSTLNNMSPKLAYWPIQGRAAPIKMALAYAGVDYQDITYDMGAAEGADNHWGTQKSKQGLAFPNLPWYIDDNVKLTQSNAILRHIGRKIIYSERMQMRHLRLTCSLIHLEIF